MTKPDMYAIIMNQDSLVHWLIGAAARHEVIVQLFNATGIDFYNEFNAEPQTPTIKFVF